jgi:alpha-galactosidase
MSRIAFIGAGSVIFTRKLLRDLLEMPALRGVDIALHDIDDDRLATAEAMAKATAAELGATPKITAHRDRRAALEGANYVLNMVQIGGHPATLLDFEIPTKHGLRQTIADTLGIGGIFRALRTAPHMLDLGREMAELCPSAWLLNYTNPMAMLCWITYAGTPTTKVVGLCHSVQYTIEQLSEFVGVPEAEVSFDSAGLNHQAFILRFEHEGKDLYPRLAAKFAGDPELQRRVRVEIYRRFGYFPTESSEHGAEYVPWFMHSQAEIDRYRIPVDEYIRRSEENLVEYDTVKAALAKGELPAIPRSNEYAADIINAMEGGGAAVIYGNVRNDALLPGVPDGSCVEVACDVNESGLHPRAVAEYPSQLAALNRTFGNVVEMTTRAVLERRRDHVYHAALLDPNAAASLSVDQIVAVCDELFDAHADVLAPLELT